MQSSHRPEIERALRFIGNHLDHPIRVAEVARAAHLSEFHLNRVFHASVGESIGRFITRRRLELAALRLAYQPDESIGEIALSSGYSSSSNFSKAFASYFGCSPTSVRAPEQALPPGVGQIVALHGKDFRPGDLYSLPSEAEPESVAREAALWEGRVRYENVKTRSFACLAVPGGYDASRIEVAWIDLIARARQLGLAQEEVDAWGIAHDSPEITAPEKCRYQACVPCSPDTRLPPPLVHGHMPEGRYAVFSYRGAVPSVAQAYRSIYSCWFRASSLAPADFTPFDHYVGDFPRNGEVDLEFWLRVRPRRDLG